MHTISKLLTTKQNNNNKISYNNHNDRWTRLWPSIGLQENNYNYNIKYYNNKPTTAPKQRRISNKKARLMKKNLSKFLSAEIHAAYKAEGTILSALTKPIVKFFDYTVSLKTKLTNMLWGCMNSISKWFTSKARQAVGSLIESMVTCMVSSAVGDSNDSAKKIYDYFDTNKVSILLLFGVFAAGVGVLFGAGKHLLSTAISYVCPHVAQDSMTSSIGMVITLVSAVFGSLIFRKADVFTHLRDVATSLLKLPANISIAGAMVGLMPEAIRLALVGMFGSSEAKRETEAMLWLRKANEVIAYAGTTQNFCEENTVQALEDIVVQGTDITSPMIKANRISPMLVRTLSSALTALAQAQACQSEAATRPKPFFVHMFGPSCTGKSYTRDKWIVEEWAASKLKDQGLKPKSFPWNTHSKDNFMSGFNHSYNVVVADELFPKVTTEALTDVCSDLLCMLSSAVFHPACPSIEPNSCGMKGDTFYPRFMFTSSNMMLPGASNMALADFVALTGRFCRVLQFYVVGGASPEPSVRGSQLNEDYWRYVRIKPGFINRLGEFQSFWPADKFITSKEELFMMLDSWYGAYLTVDKNKWPEAPNVLDQTTDAIATRLDEDIAKLFQPEAVAQGNLEDIELVPTDAEISVTPEMAQDYLDTGGESEDVDEMATLSALHICSYRKIMLKSVAYFRSARDTGHVLMNMPIFDRSITTLQQFLKLNPNFMTSKYSNADLACTVLSKNEKRAYTAFVRLCPLRLHEHEKLMFESFQSLRSGGLNRSTNVPCLEVLNYVFAQFQPTKVEAALAMLCACEALAPAKIALVAVIMCAFALAFVCLRTLAKLIFKKDRAVCHSWEQTESKPTINQKPITRIVDPVSKTANVAHSAENTATFSLSYYGKTHQMKGLVVDGDCFVTYNHALSIHASDEVGCLEYRGKSYRVALPKHRVKCENSDLAAFVLPKVDLDGLTLEKARSGVPSLFATERELNGLSRNTIYCRDGSPYRSKGARVVNQPFHYTNEVNADDCAVTDYIKLDIPSKHGDCGSFYYATLNNEEKIVAMHVAGPPTGAAGEAIAAVLTQQQIKHMVSAARDIDFKAVAQGNVQCIEEIPKQERVHLPTRTKYTRSVLFDKFDCELQPAILSTYDSRAEGRDPVQLAINEMENDHQVQLDPVLLDFCFEEIYNRLKSMVVPTHSISLTDAIRGDGGFVEPTPTDTSCGWPYNMLHIKRIDLLEMRDEGYIATAELASDVSNVRSLVRSGDIPALLQSPWCLYLKDELVRPKKIKNCRTRVVACSPFPYYLVWKQMYGHFFGQLNKMGPNQPYAIGMNPCSADMQHIYNYLMETSPEGFIAGDYTGFDRHYQLDVLRKAYGMIGRLFRANSDDVEAIKAWPVFVATQTEAPLQIGGTRFKLKVNHNSGCILTTVLNCVVNEVYIRYAFYRLNPRLKFDKHVRCVVLGDDHIISHSKSSRFDFSDIKDVMTELGQIYTTDRKDEVDPPENRPFTEITFLGCHPVKTEIGWVGKLKKTSLEKSLAWQTSDSALVQSAQQVYSYAAVWGKEYFNEIAEKVSSVLAPEYTWDFYRSQQLRTRAWPVSSVAHSTLTTFSGTNTGTTFTESSVKDYQIESCEDPQMTVSTGPDSFVLRQTYNWTSAMARGTYLFTTNCPSGMLKLYPNGQVGNLQNMQNMPFERFVLWRGDQEWKVQVNGTPMHQGLLCLYWMPLSRKTNLKNVTAANHVLVAPNASSSTTLGAMFQYPRTYLNTFAFDSPVQPPLGQLHLVVLVPLASPQGKPVTVSIYSRFPNSEFHLPRPVLVGSTPNQRLGYPKAVAQMDMVVGAAGALFNTLGALPDEKKLSNTLGNVFPPLRMLGALGLDAPARASGSLAFAPQYPGMSRAVGERQCVGLQLNPSAVYTHSEKYFNTGENTLAYLASRPCILRWDNWSTTDIEGKDIFEIPLNSILGNFDAGVYDNDFQLSLSVANMFQFWHGDYVFEFRVVKTPFHSGRLRFMIAYGGSEGMETSTVYFNQILNFDATESVAQVKVPWNAVTEFLRSFDGNEASGSLTDYLLGFAKLEVCNVLTTSLELNSVTIQTSVWMDPLSVRFAVPKALPLVGFADATFSIPSSSAAVLLDGNAKDVDGLYGAKEPPMITPLPAYVAQGDEIGPGAIAENATEIPEVPMTRDTPDELTPPESIVPASKFEYLPQTVEELLRRFQTTTALKPVLRHPFITCYSGWSGSLLLRVITEDGTNTRVTCYQPPPYDSSEPVGFDLNQLSFGGTRTNTTNPIELLAAMRRGDNQWIDLMLPFQSHLGFHRTYAGIAPGREECQAVYTSKAPKAMFVAAGDDYRLGVFHPPSQCVLGFDGTSATTKSAAGLGLFLLWI